jgi:TRAP-type uncharacterized transport system substrate-binding protein
MALALLGLQLAANAQSLPKRETAAAAAVRKADTAAKERINAWTVGLAGGFIEGAPLRLAAEIARVVNEEDKLHVIPIVTRGATENVNSLLYLRGVDAAIINTDALDEYKAQVPFIEQRIVYILNLFPAELHIFVRPEIRSADLQPVGPECGKDVHSAPGSIGTNEARRSLGRRVCDVKAR